MIDFSVTEEMTFFLPSPRITWPILVATKQKLTFYQEALAMINCTATRALMLYLEAQAMTYSMEVMGRQTMHLEPDTCMEMMEMMRLFSPCKAITKPLEVTEMT